MTDLRSSIHVEIRFNGEDDPKKVVEIPLPIPPILGGDLGGGRWKWIGPLPSTRVDLDNGYSVLVELVKTSAVRSRSSGVRGTTRSPRAAPPPQPRSAKRAARATGFTCAVCEKSLPTARGLAVHRGRLHWEPARRAPPATARRDRGEPAISDRPKLRLTDVANLAVEICDRLRGGPHEVPLDVSERIARKVLRYFPDGTSRVPDYNIDTEDRADLHLLDGKMIGHEVLGRGRGRVEWWILRDRAVEELEAEA